LRFRSDPQISKGNDMSTAPLNRSPLPDAEGFSRRKAVILASGKDALGADGRSIMLSPLGDRSVLECVLQNVLELVPPQDITVVVGYRREDVCSHLGAGYHYVVQETQSGTGHAVLQAVRDLRDFDGNLLILYGDTPLFRPASIRGLLNRHNLKKAHLTLLTAVLDRPLPYDPTSAKCHIGVAHWYP
jgi:bifunctional UDP-N-acetylglucosamine pyrophosphorylase/glucosamine-1-phosphate N-acetyltransferase